MDLEVTAEAATARAEATAWLDDWLPADYESRQSDYRLDIDFRRDYQRAAFDAGWLNPSSPRALGGHELSPEAGFWVRLDFARRPAPKLPNVAGPGVVANALLAFGTEAQKIHVRAVARGDEWWCLGMSEPGSGSDLASMRTTAHEANGGFVLNGQKTWTSHARFSKFCLIFAKTNPDADPPRRGISAFVLPMDAGGLTVRPIRKITPEDEEFCEVFLDDVFVPTDALLGDLDGGWTVAMASLGHERDMIWMLNLVEAEHALSIARTHIGNGSAHLGVRYSRLVARSDAIWLTGLRGLAHRLAAEPDNETVLLKVGSTELAQAAFQLAADAVGAIAAIAGDENWIGGEVAAGELEALGSTLYGGTSEIQRNIIGERVLDLPRARR